MHASAFLWFPTVWHHMTRTYWRVFVSCRLNRKYFECKKTENLQCSTLKNTQPVKTFQWNAHIAYGKQKNIASKFTELARKQTWTTNRTNRNRKQRQRPAHSHIRTFPARIRILIAYNILSILLIANGAALFAWRTLDIRLAQHISLEIAKSFVNYIHTEPTNRQMPSPHNVEMRKIEISLYPWVMAGMNDLCHLPFAFA